MFSFKKIKVSRKLECSNLMHQKFKSIKRNIQLNNFLPLKIEQIRDIVDLLISGLYSFFFTLFSLFLNNDLPPHSFLQTEMQLLQLSFFYFYQI